MKRRLLRPSIRGDLGAVLPAASSTYVESASSVLGARGADLPSARRPRYGAVSHPAPRALLATAAATTLRRVPDGNDVGRLVRAAGEGDRAAEAVLCARFAPVARVFALRRLGTSGADDFVQEALVVFVRALRERRIDDPDHAGSFVLGVCRNLARAGARVDERRAALLTLADFPKAGDLLEEIDARIERFRVEDCLMRVTERARQVLRRRYESGERDAEIAGALGLSEGNVRVLRHRTLALLRECLEGA